MHKFFLIRQSPTWTRVKDVVNFLKPRVVSVFGSVYEAWQHVNTAIRRNSKAILKFVSSALLVASAWYGFIFLVGDPPIDTTPALIMVWASVLVLFFALFPRLLDRVKRLKVKDFELELQESVRTSAADDDFISLDDRGDYVFSRKGGFRDLTELLDLAKENPDKQVMLTVNLRDGRDISITMLFIYLFAIDLTGSKVNVLFVSTERPFRDYSDVPKRSILGVVDGKRVMRVLFQRRPWLSRIYSLERDTGIRIDRVIHWEPGRRGRWQQSRHMFEEILHVLENLGPEDREPSEHFLSRAVVRSWFDADLNIGFVDLDDVEASKRDVRRALVRGDEYLIGISDGKFGSVVAVCKVAKRISAKVLDEV